MKLTAAPRTARFFTAALVVWITLAAVQTAITVGLGNGSTPWWKIAIINGAHAFAWALITVGVRDLTRLLRSQPAVAKLAGHVVAIIVIAVLDALTRRGVTMLLVDTQMVSFFRTTLYYIDITALSYIFAVWFGKVIAAREALLAHARHELALRAQLSRARLTYLQAQLQPHFLFNALSTVSEQIFESPSAAINTFRQLSQVLRAAASRDEAEIKLSDEVAGLLPYLEVQRTRFSDWLEIKLDIDAAAGDLLVPPLLLQPLVENSIRHGLRGRSRRGQVSIVAAMAEGKLVLSVRDNGVGLSATETLRRTGVGLSNTHERLNTLYGNDAKLTLFNDSQGGAVAEVSMPARVATGSVVIESGAPLPELEPGSGFVRRHPILTLAAGCIVASGLWTQQSYSYMLVSGRAGGRSILELARDDFVMVAMWAAMVPIAIWFSRRAPVTGPRWPIAALMHTTAIALLGLAHAGLAVAYRSEGIVLQTFRGTLPITLFVYVGALAWSQRRVFEGWLAERQVAAMKINAGITEARIAAASMTVAPESLDFTLHELEKYAADDPLKAEQAIARLGSELRATLEGGFVEAQPDAISARGRTLGGENRIERLAMGA